MLRLDPEESLTVALTGSCLPIPSLTRSGQIPSFKGECCSWFDCTIQASAPGPSETYLAHTPMAAFKHFASSKERPPCPQSHPRFPPPSSASKVLPEEIQNKPHAS